MRAFFALFFLGISSFFLPSFAFSEIDEVMENVLLERTPKKTSKAHETRKAIMLFTDKVHGSSASEIVEIGKESEFGDLKLKLTRCVVAENGAEEYAFVSIFDAAQKGVVFSGWMMKNSGSSSSLEHPRYDVTLIKCA